jgi:hypothetical protein
MKEARAGVPQEPKTSDPTPHPLTIEQHRWYSSPLDHRQECSPFMHYPAT